MRNLEWKCLGFLFLILKQCKQSEIQDVSQGKVLITVNEIDLECEGNEMV